MVSQLGQTMNLKYDSNDVTYSIGTPPKKFLLNIATDSMVISPVANSPVGKHAHYKSSASSTFIKNGTLPSYLVQTSAGVVKGFVSVDTIGIDGFTFPNTKFMEPSDTTAFDGFKDVKYEGIFGLGLDVDGPYKLPNAFQKMAMDGKLDKPQFAMYMGKKGSPELTLGGVKSAHFTGPINYVSVISTGAWWIQTDKVTIGNTVVSSKPTYGFFDSGANVISAPPLQLATIVKAIGAKQNSDGSYGINCESKSPALAIMLGGKPYVFERPTTRTMTALAIASWCSPTRGMMKPGASVPPSCRNTIQSLISAPTLRILVLALPCRTKTISFPYTENSVSIRPHRHE